METLYSLYSKQNRRQTEKATAKGMGERPRRTEKGKGGQRTTGTSNGKGNGKRQRQQVVVDVVVARDTLHSVSRVWPPIHIAKGHSPLEITERHSLLCVENILSPLYREGVPLISLIPLILLIAIECIQNVFKMYLGCISLLYREDTSSSF